ncbi:transcriptional regulator, TetR family [Carnobacterium iners]|uniref:Transcriptional regulator, TetR family n=1 Tax=Carnobacterium iners TaxID=1073423 RepID=A0A1X7N882_9LACT|nr:TetR/AcrR family transcriptional regulator [Carnobacterium iners]SEL18560.1 transcriptional regulator, TetR family [Carnobacterium iners]SMH33706.1 transcriptional regulator, TetR family [Carnobacterium iners]
MARKKTILKSHILDTAYAVVKKEGFEGFTARNIAKTMDCSTQPIYLEFKNMDDLKNELYTKIKDYLTETIFANKRSEDAILNTCLNFVHFAKDEPIFFRALFLEDHLDPKRMYNLSYEEMLTAFEEKAKTSSLSKVEKRTLFETIWISVYGTAALLAQSLIELDEVALKNSLEKNINELTK